MLKDVKLAVRNFAREATKNIQKQAGEFQEYIQVCLTEIERLEFDLESQRIIIRKMSKAKAKAQLDRHHLIERIKELENK